MGGLAVVSEPLEAQEEGWQSLPPGHIACFEGDMVRVQSFDPTHDGALSAA